MQSQNIDDLFELSSKKIDLETLGEKFKFELELAYRIRCVELKFLELFAASKVSGTVHTCVGQELTGVAISSFLNSEDWVTSNHRCHGHYISRTLDWKGLVDELLGLNTGVSRGIGSSQHLFRNNFISNGTQGSLLPVASGVALQKRLEGSNAIAVSFIGEGTLGEGVVYETLNLSSIFASPHLIVCENNYYSQTTPQSKGVSGSIKQRAEAFDWRYFEADTWDIENLFQVCKEAISYVRDQKKPAFLKIDTYRLKAHSKGDDDRCQDEVAHFEKQDLVNRLIAKGLFDTEFEVITKEVDDYTESKLSCEDVFSFEDYVADQLPRRASNRSEAVVNDPVVMVKALNSAYKNEVSNGAYFIGEDILDPYGGAFKVTKTFSDEYPDKILSTSISEAGLVGIAIGISISGGKAFAEIMFGDFIVNALDQIVNNACKFYHMYGKQFSCDVTVRTPMGGGRGYGPTHSQSLEKMLLGQENLAVIALSSLIDPVRAIEGAATIDSPKVIIEHKVDYSSFLYQAPNKLNLNLIGGDLGSVHLSPNGGCARVLVISYGYTARLIADNYEEIFRRSDIVFELLSPQLLHPIPVAHIDRLLKRFDTVLVVEEGSAGFGWADGVVSIIAQNHPGTIVKTASSYPIPIPSKRTLESESLISIEKIIVALSKLGAAH